jgi:hypothetical protein
MEFEEYKSPDSRSAKFAHVTVMFINGAKRGWTFLNGRGFLRSIGEPLLSKDRRRTS